MAALCAGEQNQFWPYADTVFNNQGALDLDSLRRYAAGLGLDMNAYDACVSSKKFQQILDADLADAKRLGVSGTPAFFVNGRPLEGALPLESFQEIIDEELTSNG
jgi:protein-disulfide isomerase